MELLAQELLSLASGHSSLPVSWSMITLALKTRLKRFILATRQHARDPTSCKVGEATASIPPGERFGKKR